MFNEEITSAEQAQGRKTKKEKILTVIALVLLIAALASMFYCGYTVSDLTFSTRNNDDYQYVKEVVEGSYNFNNYDEKLAEHSAINGYLSSLGDNYAIYMSPEEYEKRQMSGRGESISLGLEITLNEDLQIVVKGLVQGGNAIGSGIEVGDILVSINGCSVRNYDEYKNYTIQNFFKDGDNVEVVVSRNGEELSFNVITNKITVPVCELSYIDNIAYIKLTTFSELSAQKFNECIGEINNNKNCAGIIIDLRGNGGGLVTAMEQIAGCFLNNKLIATFEFKTNKETHTAKKSENFTDLPVVILVNGNSASASECFSGAMQCHDRATIVGTQTYGKGIGQSTYKCPSGGYVTITTSKYYLPDGTWIHEVGVTPDEIIDLPEEIKNGMVELTQENDTQLIAAKKYFQNK